VAIKTVVFESGSHTSQTALVASEAAIASNLMHNNIVKTYKHDVRTISDTQGTELGIFKLFLVQVPLHCCLLAFILWRASRRLL
jgi:hypothetical protein